MNIWQFIRYRNIYQSSTSGPPVRQKADLVNPDPKAFWQTAIPCVLTGMVADSHMGVCWQQTPVERYIDKYLYTPTTFTAIIITRWFLQILA